MVSDNLCDGKFEDRRGIGIIGCGKYLPEKTLTNADFERLVDTSDEWIIQRTGISERRVVSEGETTLSIALCAARAALDDAGMAGGQVGLVIVATATPDYYSPATASHIQHAIGASNCAAFDINVGCTGSTYALVLAENYLRSGAARFALVVGAETLTRVTDFTDRKTCILFGDGAGAVVLGFVPDGYGIVASHLRSDGQDADCITIPGLYSTEDDIERRGGVKKPTIWLDGGKVMKFATRTMAATVREIAERANVPLDDIKLVIPHQANIRIIEGAAKRLGIGMDRIYTNIGRYGNTSAASVLIALREAEDEGRVQNGDNIAIVAFGAGLTYGGLMIRWY